MRPRTYLAGVVAVCATILVSAGLLAQENPYGEMTPEQQQMMQKWMEFATPGEHHEQLSRRVGEWQVDGMMWEAPDSAPQPFTATSTIESIMGGRYFLERIEGPGPMGTPFEARGVFGYDNLTRTYFNFWFDNMSTGVARYKGTSSGDGKTIHYTVQAPDPLTGRYKEARATDRMIDDDHSIFTYYDTTPEGDEYKHMEIHVTRVGAEPLKHGD